MEANATRYLGGCACGAVRYEAHGPAMDACFCHCDSCRRAAGAPAVPWVTFERARFAITRGEPREFRSSPPVQRGFCGTCGTSLTYRTDAHPEEIDVAIATLDDQESVRPDVHLWVDDKPSWVVLRDGLPQFAERRVGARSGRSVRPGYGTVSVRLIAADAVKLAEFIQHVFDAQGELAANRPAELVVGDSVIMVSEASERRSAAGFLYVYVPDADAAYERALARGARSLEAPTVVAYGDRRCMVEDPWSNRWQIASYLTSDAR
jgi:uncharacterized glyoxalase superfamily protein PhnB